MKYQVIYNKQSKDKNFKTGIILSLKIAQNTLSQIKGTYPDAEIVEVEC